MPRNELWVQAVAELFTLSQGRLWTDGVPPALQSLSHTSYGDCLRLQLDVLATWERSGARLGGWKIGLTSRGARDAMGVGVRPHGYVLQNRILPSASQLPEDIPNCRVEPEIAVILGQDLRGPNVTVEQARSAVASVAPAFEINSNRVHKTSSMAVRLGNSLNNWGIVLGEPLEARRIDLSELAIEVGDESGAIESGTSAASTLDDPYLSLSRVCASLALNGGGLSAGQPLITGSLTAAVPTRARQSLYADFGALGRVMVEIP